MDPKDEASEMIQYENVTKIFGHGTQAVTAVSDVNMEIEDGNLVTIVGPSGCGKTTLLRLTNRLIPLTRGKITVGGQDITAVDPVKLRQSMGYAIQAVGLFPNKTIYENIATVPRLLKWEESKIESRVEELFHMLRMDPDAFRDRYPVELSGGQQQRIGVARCLAADPNLLLMDEPFGAIDPINREDIQNEFLRVQEKLKKTILFITHDIHEAIKMGDKIAVFQDGSLIQYDTPEAILTHPKNSYIADFVGSDRALKVLGLLRVKDAVNKNPANIVTASQKAPDVLTLFKKQDWDHAVVVEENKPLGYVTAPSLERHQGPVKERIERYSKHMKMYDTLKDTISYMLMKDLQALCVVDDNGDLVGIIRMADIQQAMLDIYRAEEPG